MTGEEITSELINNKQNYFIFINLDKNLEVGGYLEGRNYGGIKYVFQKESIFQKIYITNGISTVESSSSNRTIDKEKNKAEYELLIDFFKEIEKRAKTNSDDDDRQKLCENLFRLLKPNTEPPREIN